MFGQSVAFQMCSLWYAALRFTASPAAFPRPYSECDGEIGRVRPEMPDVLTSCLLFKVILTVLAKPGKAGAPGSLACRF
jgi:hypothetical protein